MIKHPMTRILSCGILAASLLGSHASTALQIPTVSAKSNSVNEQKESQQQQEEEVATKQKQTTEKQKTKVEKFKKGWLKDYTKIMENPKKSSQVLTTYPFNKKVKYTNYNKKWVKIKYKKGYAYIQKRFISKKKLKPTDWTYSGEKWTLKKGVVYGPSGKETGYNLNMTEVIRLMKQLGYDYEYWIREDGIKMYGDYVMIATNTYKVPKGSIIPTTLGMAMVCDHCVAAESYAEKGIFIDIAMSF